MYKFIRSLFFQLDAERAHHVVMGLLRTLCGVGLFRKILRKLFCMEAPLLEREAFGLRFRNVVGLAAGFDKNALYLRELECLGFGSVEIGTVTPRPQAGNPKPRMFRLPKDHALVNRMGFNNDGVEAIAARLKAWRQQERHGQQGKLIIGGNIGKNKDTPNEDAWKDYESCLLGLIDHVDYFVVNVSSPNTPGLRALQDRGSLEKILRHLQQLNKRHSNPKPILLKIAPDLSMAQIDDVIALALEIELDGIVACNTTISREGLTTDATVVEGIGAGGLSGMPLRGRSTEVVRYICDRLQGKVPVIASGGIFTAADAKEKLDAGAVLVQVWTGFVYVGPSIVKRILKGIAP